MNGIPLPALILGFAGLIPFVLGALDLNGWLRLPEALTVLIAGADGVLLLPYGKIILAFMGGCLWGFAARDDTPKAALGFGLSVLPALYAFLIVGQSLLVLAFGFALLLLIDHWFLRHDLAPTWWMSLRIPISGIVILSLILGSTA